MLASTPALFHNVELLGETVAGLGAAGFEVVEFDASRWLTTATMYGDFARVFYFEHDHSELQGLSECLRDSLYTEGGRFVEIDDLVIVMTGFDHFYREFPDTAVGLLDILTEMWVGGLLAGNRLVCLLQSDDPRLALPPVGLRYIRWNQDEFYDVQRGLPGFRLPWMRIPGSPSS